MSELLLEDLRRQIQHGQAIVVVGAGVSIGATGGAGKTALGVAACLEFTRTRALVVTPGNVVRGTFDRALTPGNPRNVLYTLPGGPLIPGCRPPEIRTLDRDHGPTRGVTREELLAADVIVTNFHSLGTGQEPEQLLGKLAPTDVDLIVVDEAHIAAAESYQHLFRHFANARTLLMSACFQRLDGKPIDADVVYRYLLRHAVEDRNAKKLCVTFMEFIRRVHGDDPEETPDA